MSYSLQAGLPLENVCVRALASTASRATLPLPMELHCELHVAWIVLYVMNLAKTATRLMDQIHRAVCKWRQAKAGIGRCQILMVQSVQQIPPKVKVFSLGYVKLLLQGRIQIPKTRSPDLRKDGPSRSVVVSAVGVRVVIGPEVVGVRAKRRLKRPRINPMRRILTSRDGPRIPYHVATARHLVRGIR